jgi:hypothetical protein
MEYLDYADLIGGANKDSLVASARCKRVPYVARGSILSTTDHSSEDYALWDMLFSTFLQPPLFSTSSSNGLKSTNGAASSPTSA